jgi:hypothetical protein
MVQMLAHFRQRTFSHGPAAADGPAPLGAIGGASPQSITSNRA